MSLTPKESHYLKSQLIGLVLQREFDDCWNESANFLKLLGPPFAGASRADVLYTDHDRFLVLKFVFVQFVQTFPYFRNIDRKFSFVKSGHIVQKSSGDQGSSQFWSTKILPFYEYIMSKNLNSHLDREELSKRRKSTIKLYRNLKLFFGSAIATELDEDYYNIGQTGEKLNQEAEKQLSDNLDKIEKVKFDMSEAEINQLIGESSFKCINGFNVKIIGVRQVEIEPQGSGFLVSMFKGAAPTKVYEFIVQVRYEADDLPSQDFKIFRRYSDFRDLQNSLKKQLPTAQLPNLPHKYKHATETSTVEETEATEDFDVFEIDEFNEELLEMSKKSAYVKQGQTAVLPREKLRVLLNNYLKALVKIAEVAQSVIFKEFLFKGSVSKLSESDLRDVALRKHVEYLTVKKELVFQQKMHLMNMRLNNELATFKNIVFNSRNMEFLHKQYSKEKIEQYSFYLKIQENESVLLYLLKEFKTKTKFKDFSPVTQMGIKWAMLNLASFVYDMFFTRTEDSFEFVSIDLFNQIKRFHTMFPYLLLQSVLKITNPILMMKRMIDLFLYQAPGMSSLIQMLFSSVLSSDLAQIDQNISNLMSEIRNNIKNDHFAEIMELLSVRDFGLLEPSHIGYLKTKFKNKTELHAQLLKLERLCCKRNDKEQFRQLWKEQYLNNFLKDFFTIFFSPLVSIFAKNKSFKDIVKEIKGFMDDMISLVEYLFDHLYLLDANKIIASIYLVISKRLPYVLEFLHQSYLNDKDNFFESLVEWASSIFKFLSTAKQNPINIESILTKLGSEVDLDILKREINAVVSARSTRAVHQKVSHKSKLEENWEKLNEVSFINLNDLPIDAKTMEQLVDGYDSSDESDQSSFKSSSSHISQKMAGRTGTNYYEQGVQMTETAKLVPMFKKQLGSVLRQYISS